MGTMTAAKDALTFFSPEEYARKKEKILSSYDPAIEMNVGGSLFCRVCKQPTVYDDPSRLFIARCVCRCRLEEERRAKQAQERSERAKRFREAAEKMNVLGRAYAGAGFYSISLSGAEDSYIRAVERCEKFCNNFDAVRKSGHGIWLWGDTGVGKTFIGACMLRLLEKDGRMCIFTSAEKILDEVRATYKSATETAKEIKEILVNAEVLFIDRIDETRGKTESAVQTIAEIVRSRDDDRRPTVILSRVSMADYAAQSGMDRGILDRLSARMASMKLVGKNRFLSMPGEMEF